MSTKIIDKYLNGFVGEDEYKGIEAQVKNAHKALHDGTGLGNDFIGWVDLPTNYDKEEFARIKKAAKKIQSDTDVFIVIGIGGSYLGAKSGNRVPHIPELQRIVQRHTADLLHR